MNESSIRARSSTRAPATVGEGRLARSSASNAPFASSVVRSARAELAGQLTRERRVGVEQARRPSEQIDRRRCVIALPGEEPGSAEPLSCVRGELADVAILGAELRAQGMCAFEVQTD